MALSLGQLYTGAELGNISFSYNLGGSTGTKTLKDVCDLDPVKDAAVAVHVTATSTTADFSTYLSFNVRGRVDSSDYRAPTSMSEDKRFRYADVYSGGDDTCTSAVGYSGTGGTHWSEPVKTGETRTKTFYILIRDWRTPAAPAGDMSVLKVFGLAPARSSAGSSASSSGGEAYEPANDALTLYFDGHRE